MNDIELQPLLVIPNLTQSDSPMLRLFKKNGHTEKQREPEAWHEVLRTIELLRGDAKISLIHWRKCSCFDPHTLILQMDPA